MNASIYIMDISKSINKIADLFKIEPVVDVAKCSQYLGYFVRNYYVCILE